MEQSDQSLHCFLFFICPNIYDFYVKSLGAELTNVNSSLRLISHDRASRIAQGENLSFTFSVKVNVSHRNDELTVKIYGSNLEALKVENSIQNLTLTWLSSNGSCFDTDGRRIAITNRQVTTMPDAELFHITSTLKIEQSILTSIQGTIQLRVEDKTPLGAFIRPTMHVSVGTEKVIINGDYVYMEIPKMTLSAGDPLRIDFKEKSKVNADIEWHSVPLEPSLLKVYLPNNQTFSKEILNIQVAEPYLSISSFSLERSSGLTSSTARKLKKVKVRTTSYSQSSEKSQAIFSLPKLEPASKKNVELSFSAGAELLDHVASNETEKMPVVFIFETGNFIVIKITNIYPELHQDGDRQPNLTIVYSHLKTYSHMEKPVMTFQLGLDHAPNSWGSAYDVMLMMYMFPGLTNFRVSSAADVLKSHTTIATIIGGSVIVFEMRRVSFVHHPRLIFNLTLDLDPDIGVTDGMMSLIVEAVYRGWRDARDFDVLQNFLVKVPVQTDYEESKGEDDKINYTCKCSSETSPECECGNHGDACQSLDFTCVPCSKPWKCMRTQDGYGDESFLKTTTGYQYACGKPQRYRQFKGIKRCLKYSVDGMAQAISPTLGAIQAYDAETGYLYGISRNGMASVFSQDEGKSWTTISSALYKEVTGKDSTTLVHQQPTPKAPK